MVGKEYHAKSTNLPVSAADACLFGMVSWRAFKVHILQRAQSYRLTDGTAPALTKSSFLPRNLSVGKVVGDCVNSEPQTIGNMEILPTALLIP
jgi:hypothetical protein